MIIPDMVVWDTLKIFSVKTTKKLISDTKSFSLLLRAYNLTK